MGLFGLGTSESNQTQISLSDTKTTAGANSPIGSPASANTNTAGTQYNSGRDISIVNPDSTSVVSGALDAVKQLASSTLDSISSTTGRVLATDQATAANTASGGQTNTNQTILYALGILAAAIVGAAYFFRKKS